MNIGKKDKKQKRKKNNDLQTERRFFCNFFLLVTLNGMYFVAEIFRFQFWL